MWRLLLIVNGKKAFSSNPYFHICDFLCDLQNLFFQSVSQWMQLNKKQIFLGYLVVAEGTDLLHQLYIHWLITLMRQSTVFLASHLFQGNTRYIIGAELHIFPFIVMIMSFFKKNLSSASRCAYICLYMYVCVTISTSLPFFKLSNW